MTRIISVGFVLLLIALGIWGFALRSAYKSPLSIEKKKGASGLSEYTIIYKNGAKIDFRTTRPDKKDTTVLLCIPGAFTRLNDYKIDGLYICNGVVGNKTNINHTLGGGVKILNGECTIFHTGYGKLLTDSLVDSIVAHKGSFFQQIWMINNGKVADFNEDILTYRRGIAVFGNGKTAIIESTSPITLKTFATDLSAMGVVNLLYTDMGSWDEGWYRNPANGDIITMGYSLAETDKQSNWLILRR